jgi:SAM-dependent methyltransferase
VKSKNVLETPTRSPVEERRAHLHAAWEAVSKAWADQTDFTDARSAQDTARLLSLVGPQPGELLLELACGAGSLSIKAASLVGPTGRVVASDISAVMVATTARRAADRGLSNLTVCRLDLEQIDADDASYDVVACRDGLQFALAPGQAVREIHRVLKPEGRLGVVVWAAQERNPWLGVVMDAVSAQVGKPVPPPGLPGPFSLGDPTSLAELLRAGGLADVSVEEISVPMYAGSFEAWWGRTSALAGPLSSLLAALPAGTRRALDRRLRADVAPFETAGGLEFPGVALIATGRRTS